MTPARVLVQMWHDCWKPRAGSSSSLDEPTRPMTPTPKPWPTFLRRQRAWRARLEALLGAVEGARGRHAEAQQHLLAAEATLGDPPSDDDREWWRTWIDVRDSRVGRAYWLGETDEMETLIASLDEPVRLHGTAQQRAEHHDTIAIVPPASRQVPPVPGGARSQAGGGRGNRRAGGSARDRPRDRFTLGFTYSWNLDLVAAERELRAALAEAEQIGDALLEARSFTYLSIVLRRQGRPPRSASGWSRGRSRQASVGSASSRYDAMALANRAWAELQTGGPQGAARGDAETAGRTWPAEPPYPFRWLDLWPLIAVDVAEKRFDDAVPALWLLLDRAQQPPAAPVKEALETVLVIAETIRGSSRRASSARSTRRASTPTL